MAPSFAVSRVCSSRCTSFSGIRGSRLNRRHATLRLCAAAAAETTDTRVPSTVITGFLGSGKTTLLNKALSLPHGKRIALIVNEFGEISIDDKLLSATSAVTEDIMLLNNGCLCCTVRGDLVRMISELVDERGDEIDHILIETTGLADPRPIIHTFFNDLEVAKRTRLDGVVTLVDAMFAEKHLAKKGEHKEEVNEAKEQICFADRILINKTDLVDEATVLALEERVNRLNALAKRKRTTFGEADIDWILGIGGFDLETVAKDLEAKFKSHGEEEDDEHHHHSHTHKHEGHTHQEGGGGGGEDDTHHHHHHHHHHHDDVGSVSLLLPGNLDLEKVNTWLGSLVQFRADDIYRMKGVLSVEGWERRFVFQGVHQLFSGGPEEEWGQEEERISRLVFIGKNLNHGDFEETFRECLAGK